jgi:hypothetical protein
MKNNPQKIKFQFQVVSQYHRAGRVYVGSGTKHLHPQAHRLEKIGERSAHRSSSSDDEDDRLLSYAGIWVTTFD